MRAGTAGLLTLEAGLYLFAEICIFVRIVFAPGILLKLVLQMPFFRFYSFCMFLDEFLLDLVSMHGARGRLSIFIQFLSAVHDVCNMNRKN